MCSLPIEIIARIADNSYRARQLLRLTCKTYHDKIKEYIYTIVTKQGLAILTENCTHKELIDHLMRLLCCKSWLDWPTIYTHHPTLRPLISWGWQPYPRLDGTLGVGNGWYDLVFYIGDGECKLICQADWAADIWIENVTYQLVETSYSVQDIIDFVRENIPELHVRPRGGTQ